MPTQQYLDTYNFARTMDLSKYSVLCCCGGDGSYHETVNGMLDREDKIKIPVAFLPNGSGNDLCRSLGYTTLDQGLSYIIKAQCIKIDTVRVLIDHENEATLPEGNEKLNFCRHMMVNSAIAMPAKISNTAIPLKSCCGTSSYKLATLWEAMCGRFKPDDYELHIDDQQVRINGADTISSTLLMVVNGKNSGAGMLINPFPVINDGLIDVAWISDPSVNCLTGVAGLMGDAKEKAGI